MVRIGGRIALGCARRDTAPRATATLRSLQFRFKRDKEMNGRQMLRAAARWLPPAHFRHSRAQPRRCRRPCPVALRLRAPRLRLLCWRAAPSSCPRATTCCFLFHNASLRHNKWSLELFGSAANWRRDKWAVLVLVIYGHANDNSLVGDGHSALARARPPSVTWAANEFQWPACEQSSSSSGCNKASGPWLVRGLRSSAEGRALFVFSPNLIYSTCHCCVGIGDRAIGRG